MPPPRQRNSFPTRRSSDLYTRARGPTESTEFSLTRFLVPALAGFRGWSIFMDCDMLCRADLAGLESEIEDRKSTRLNSSHQIISYAVFCLKKKNTVNPKKC